MVMGGGMSEGSELLLTVVVVSWNTREVTKRCLRALFAHETTVPFTVYVVDNASSDGSAEMVEEEFPQVRLLRNSENVGFARANNAVLRMVSTPYALLLNSDAFLPPRDLLTPWVSFMEAHPEVGASGCRLVFPDGRHQVGDAGYQPSLASLLAHAFFLSRLFPREVRGLFVVGLEEGDPIREVDWVSGAAMMVRMSAVREVGLMDERVFMFAEDIEWGCRFRAKGWRVCLLPSLSLVHLQGASGKRQKKPSEFSLLWLKNLKRLYGRLNPSMPLWSFTVVMAMGFFLRLQLYGWWGVLRGRRDLREKAARMAHYMAGVFSC